MKRILVPLDGGPEAEAILPAVRNLATALASGVSLLSVVERPEDRVARGSYLEARRKELSGAGLDVSSLVEVGPVAAGVVARASMPETDFVAMTTHGRRGLERLRMGSVAEEVLRHSPVPLFVVRPDAATLEGKRILVALDGSPAAEAVLPDAVRLARVLALPIDLMRVVFPAPIPGGLGEPLIPLPAIDPMPFLKGVQARLEAEGAAEVRPVALEGRAATQIVLHAKEAGGALLCITTHGRTGLARLVFGSIAEELLRTAPCPVWVRRSASL